MAVTAWKSANAASNDASSGHTSLKWTGASGVALSTELSADDGNEAITWDDGEVIQSQVTSTKTPTQILVGTDFGFTTDDVPDGSTIDGIEVEVTRRASNADRIGDERVRIVKGGVIGSTDRASATLWPQTEATEGYGSSTDLWGETWADSEVRAIDFGAALAAKHVSGGGSAPHVDQLRIRVYYTAGSLPQTLSGAVASSVWDATTGALAALAVLSGVVAADPWEATTGDASSVVSLQGSVAASAWQATTGALLPGGAALVGDPAADLWQAEPGDLIPGQALLGGAVTTDAWLAETGDLLPGAVSLSGIAAADLWESSTGELAGGIATLVGDVAADPWLATTGIIEGGPQQLSGAVAIDPWAAADGVLVAGAAELAGAVAADDWIAAAGELLPGTSTLSGAAAEDAWVATTGEITAGVATQTLEGSVAADLWLATDGSLTGGPATAQGVVIPGAWAATIGAIALPEQAAAPTGIFVDAARALASIADDHALEAARTLAGTMALAEDGTYTPQGGSPVELKVSAGQGVILTPAEEVIQAFDTGARRPGAMVASITQAAVPVRPSDGDALVVGAQTFVIRSAEPDAARVFWELDLDPA